VQLPWVKIDKPETANFILAMRTSDGAANQDNFFDASLPMSWAAWPWLAWSAAARGGSERSFRLNPLESKHG
jgi:hypothetical protein